MVVFGRKIINPTAALTIPLKLTSFEGQQRNKQVNLSWITAQEMDVDHFEIERSLDGRNFEAAGIVNSKYNNAQTMIDDKFM